MRKIFVLLLLCLCFGVEAEPYLALNEKATKVYRLATQLQIKNAQSALDAMRRNEPDNYCIYYLECTLDFMQVVSGDAQSDYSRFEKKLLPRIDKIARSDRKSPYYLLLQAEMHLQGAFLQARYDDYLASMSDIKQAYALLEENQKRFPDFMANKKGLGLIRIATGSIPEEYRWAASALGGIRGDVELGARELEELVNYARAHPGFLYAEEAVIAHAFTTLFLKNDEEKAWKIVNNGQLKPKENPIAAYTMAVIGNRCRHNDDAIRILTECPEGGQFAPFPFRYYLLGSFKLCRLDTDAGTALNAFLQKYKGQNGLKEAYQKIAWSKLIANNNGEYRKYMELVKTKGALRSDSDKAAMREAESGEMPDVSLLKARLLFDGGYYQRAYELLKNKQGNYPESGKNALEFHYRMGRICQKLERYSEAEQYYDRTIKDGAQQPWYFACNAALQKGLMFQDQGKYEKARQAFQQCLSINPEEYATGLHARAKAGLNEIKGK